ncbi:MAG: MBL fold metallo-hydrolase [Longimonas sp.]|uniref:MBL fold metallo-hydrolase n=1 Tax=Longimonas sp. TaxID=2039626 RepID=UPI003347E49D
MTIQSFTFNPFMTNMYVFHEDGEAAIIDASCSSAAEYSAVEDYVQGHDLTVTHLILTHAHIDHILGCAHLETTYDEAFYLHPSGEPFYAQAEEQAQAFGVAIEAPERTTKPLTPGDTVTVGSTTFRILHTPGHSPDSISLVADAHDIAFTGDVLFRDSIGRTQGLPQTSQPQLMASIREKLLPLGDDVTIYPGHGEVTTIGRERKHNPFLNNEVPGFAG